MHTVQQGEHMSGIAQQYGFSDYNTIWNDPNNAALQAQRQNPNVLNPGDQVYIPDKTAGSYSGATDQQHKFTSAVKPLTLQVTLQQMYYEPIANKSCQLTVGLDQWNVTSDGNGLVQHSISKTATDATVTVNDTITVEGASVPWQIELDFKIGSLDPIDQQSGQVARLANLGYYRGSLDTVDATELESAVEEFQCDNGLDLDGICGPATQAKLKDVYGC
ncbi:MAG TPA: peptidoglycan-binding protein [Bryobacteraceae bacterium]|jgi:hypothetical protein|nr:peptidoglycan-binding protein [Bryobacteraceae bacterium]